LKDKLALAKKNYNIWLKPLANLNHPPPAKAGGNSKFSFIKLNSTHKIKSYRIEACSSLSTIPVVKNYVKSIWLQTNLSEQYA